MSIVIPGLGFLLRLAWLVFFSLFLLSYARVHIQHGKLEFFFNIIWHAKVWYYLVDGELDTFQDGIEYILLLSLILLRYVPDLGFR